MAAERDVAVGVPGDDEHVEGLAGQVEAVALVDEQRRLDGAIGSSSSSPAERAASSGGMPLARRWRPKRAADSGSSQALIVCSRSIRPCTISSAPVISARRVLAPM